MGYQLWTSPVTGYRRRGTRLSDFHAGFAAKICAEEIFEPLRCCPSEASAWDMCEALKTQDFDVAGVRAAAEAPVIGLVRRGQLTSGVVRDHMESISPDMIAPSSLGIEGLLVQLRSRHFLFITNDGLLNGILTLADLNKPVVRVYFFGLLSLLEIHMSFWIGQEYESSAWQDELSDARLVRAKEIQSGRERHGQFLNLEDCLQFADKRDLVVARVGLRERLGLGSKKKARARLSEAENLRNVLAHSQYDLVQGGAWSDLIDLVQWVAKVIARSDEFVEQHAAQKSKEYIGALW